MIGGIVQGGAAPLNPPDAIPNVYNLKASNCAKTRRALARVRAGTARMTIACVGDSTTMGIGAGSDNNAAAARPKAYPTRLAQILTARGLTANADSIFGDGFAPSGYPAYDPRVTLGTGWGTTGPVSLGRQTFKATASSTGTLDFAPGTTFDTIIVYWLKSGSQSAPTVGVDAGAGITAASTTGANPGVNTSTYSCTRGTHTVNIKWTSGIDLYVVGVEVYDSTVLPISVRNMGWSGSQSSDWAGASQYYSPINAIGAVPSDLTLLCLGINDWSNGIALSTYQTNMQAIITAAVAGGDVWLVGPTASDPAYNANTAQATQDAFVATMKALALSNDLPLLDWNGREGPYSVANGLGLMTDQRHPTAVGYADKGQFIAKLLLAV